MVANHLRTDHHYLPQLYLRAWSDDGVHLCTYRTLVPHEGVRVWKKTSIDGIGYHQHLYTRRVAGQASDEFDEPDNDREQVGRRQPELLEERRCAGWSGAAPRCSRRPPRVILPR